MNNFLFITSVTRNLLLHNGRKTWLERCQSNLAFKVCNFCNAWILRNMEENAISISRASYWSKVFTHFPKRCLAKENWQRRLRFLASGVFHVLRSLQTCFEAHNMSYTTTKKCKREREQELVLRGWSSSIFNFPGGEHKNQNKKNEISIRVLKRILREPSATRMISCYCCLIGCVSSSNSTAMIRIVKDDALREGAWNGTFRSNINIQEYIKGGRTLGKVFRGK